MFGLEVAVIHKMFKESNVNIVKKKGIGKKTANMYIMRYYISLQGFINYLEQCRIMSSLTTYYIIH